MSKLYQVPITTKMAERIAVLTRRINGLQATFTEMSESIKYLEKDIISCNEYDIVLKKRLESLKKETEMNKEELIMRKIVVKNIPILIAEIKEEYDVLVKNYPNKNITEDMTLYDIWQERIVWKLTLPICYFSCSNGNRSLYLRGNHNHVFMSNTIINVLDICISTEW